MKERIIGAVLLVAVAVLVVPVFLDGPPAEEEMISQSVALPGQSDQKSQTVVLERNRTEPVPSASNGANARTPEPKPAAVRQPEPEPQGTATAAAEASPAPAADNSSTGMWAVQLGAFGDQENAERQVAELRARGFGAFRSRISTSSGELHRVRVGPQKDRASAEDIAAQLAKAGYQGQVIPHP